MASPQKENGYTSIANELLEALAGIRISGEARQCLDVIFRKTYGFNKKEDTISLSQFSLVTNMSKVRIRQAINKLAILNLIITKKGNGLGNLYRINKDFDTWKPLPKKVTVTKKGNDRYQKRKESLPITGTTKEKKETITKDIIYIQKGEFENVRLKDEEYEKLTTKLGKINTDILIEELSSYMASKGKRYSSHYATLLNWAKRKNNNHYKLKSVSII